MFARIVRCYDSSGRVCQRAPRNAVATFTRWLAAVWVSLMTAGLRSAIAHDHHRTVVTVVMVLVVIVAARAWLWMASRNS